ncbi:MAG: peptidoglycan DD-metalloendopeptidase family protein [Oscillospiraceae bacterium]|nr:peptidoglycan DD-metalloendopeptidase family protein [Oscillospiraceae bacterium]
MCRKAVDIYGNAPGVVPFSRRLFGVFCTALALIICVGGILRLLAPAARADEIDDMNDQYEALENQRKKNANDLKDAQERLANNEVMLEKLVEQADTLEAQQAILEKQSALLKAKITAADAKLADLNKQIRRTKNEIDYNTTEKERVENSIEKGTQQLMARMRANYMAGSATWLEVLLQSQNMQDYLTRTELFARLAEHDRLLLEDLDKQTKSLESLINGLAAKKIELEAQQKDATATRSDLKVQENAFNESRARLIAKQNQLEANAESVKTRMAELNASSDTFTTQRERITQQMAALEAEIRKAIAERGSSKGGADTSGGTGEVKLIFPLHVGQGDYYIGDKYGPRINPVTHLPSVHQGADIVVGYGTPVYAMAAGTAIIAHFSSSFGYYIMIDHGNGLFTLYAHASKLLIYEGDHVEQDQKIMLVGSTGMSTGAHLHIEVHIQEADGTSHTVNPLSGYVPLP